MNMITMPKMAKRIIEVNMPGSVRRAYAQGAEIRVTIVRTGRPLKRWGSAAEIVIRNNRILENSMVENAWNYDLAKAMRESAMALDYMLYGGSHEYKIIYGGI